MRLTFEIPLDIPDVTIEAMKTSQVGHIELTIQSTLEGTPCRQCGQMTTTFYDQDRKIVLRRSCRFWAATPISIFVPRGISVSSAGEIQRRLNRFHGIHPGHLIQKPMKNSFY
jgi:hypothetical protein